MLQPVQYAWCVVVVAALLSASSRPGIAQTTTTGRPIIVFIHGRDQAFKDETSLQASWFGAFKTGVKKVHGQSLLGPTDLRFVYYGDVYAPDYLPSQECRRSRGAAQRGVARDLDSAWSAARPVRGAFFDRVKNALVKHAVGIPGAMHVILNRLDDTKAYLERRAQYCDTNLALYEALDTARTTGRPIVIVAHSMGALVAYTLLSNLDMASRPPFEIRRFVTLGTQLGVESLVPYLLGQGSSSPYSVPRSIHSWVNSVGRDDFLGWPVRGHFALGRTSLVELSPRTEPGNPHGAQGYLIHPWVARAIVRAWCDAFLAPARRPQGCAQVQEVREGMRSP